MNPTFSQQLETFRNELSQLTALLTDLVVTLTGLQSTVQRLEKLQFSDPIIKDMVYQTLISYQQLIFKMTTDTSTVPNVIQPPTEQPSETEVVEAVMANTTQPTKTKTPAVTDSKKNRGLKLNRWVGIWFLLQASRKRSTKITLIELLNDVWPGGWIQLEFRFIKPGTKQFHNVSIGTQQGEVAPQFLQLLANTFLRLKAIREGTATKEQKTVAYQELSAQITDKGFERLEQLLIQWHVPIDQPTEDNPNQEENSQ